MISRKTTLILSNIVTHLFYKHNKSNSNRTSRSYNPPFCVNSEKLYDFLYENNFPAWFCNIAKETYSSGNSIQSATYKLKDFILKLHTGESISKSTPKWSWEQREKFGQNYLLDISEDILNYWYFDVITWSPLVQPISEEDINTFLRHLELDGYIYTESTLLSPENDVLNIETEKSLLRNLYISLNLENFELTLNHLNLSSEHYENGNFSDSISNSRHFFESVLREVAALYSTKKKNTKLNKRIYEQPAEVRNFLEKEGLLETKEREAFSKIYGLLSHTGNHPYMAEKDQARLLRHLSLTLSQFILLRLKCVFSLE